MVDWSLLPNDVLCLIGEKLHLTVNRIRFRSVCRTWRSLVPFPQPPWLMLAEDEQSPNTRAFFGLGRQESHPEGGKGEDVYQFELPEVYHTRCLGSTGAWLITIDLNERIRILNPFSRAQIDLPSQNTMACGPTKWITDLEALRDGYTWKVVLSSPPSSSGKECIAMALHECNRRLAIARPGDASWATVQVREIHFVDAIFYKGQFYAITITGILVVCDLSDDQGPPVANPLTSNFKEHNDKHTLYLVELKGELLLVIKFMHDNADPEEGYKVVKFEVYTMDFINRKWIELKNLREHCLFLGHNTSVGVLAAQYPGLKENCIYYSDDYRHGYIGLSIPGGLEMGVFDFQNKTITAHYKGVSTSLYSPPLWILP